MIEAQQTPPAPDDDPGDRPLVTPRAITLAVATVATALLVAIVSVLPTPYAVASPGPTRDTLGEHDGEPLVAVDGAPTYEPSGELRLTTVRVAGGPGYPVGLTGLVRGWLDGASSVTPVEQVFPPSQTREEIDERNQASMISSQENATVAALEELGHEVPTVLHVADVIEGTGAQGTIRADDVLVSVQGTEVGSFSELSAQLDAVAPGQTVTVGVERDGEPTEVEVTTTEGEAGQALLGVLIDPEFEMPLDVSIRIEDIGGPSAGTMFALAVIDTLTEADETGGEVVAGTGTMDLTGTVGPIGSIRQKLVGAVRDGAAWFLAPRANCDEVVGHVPDGLQVVAVETLHDARSAVEVIGAGDGQDLPGCA